VATIEISCVEIWRELSNYIDDDTALPFWMGLAMLSAWSAMAVRLICPQDLASA
jgi:hypothetical protein